MWVFFFSFLFEYFYFLALQDESCYLADFLSQSQILSFFEKQPISFLLENGIRNQDLLCSLLLELVAALPFNV